MAMHIAGFKTGLTALLDSGLGGDEGAFVDGLASLVQSLLESATVTVPATRVTSPVGPCTGAAVGIIS